MIGVSRISCRCWTYRKAQKLQPRSATPSRKCIANLHSNDRIDDGDSTIERKLGNLCSRKLSVCVPEFNCGSILRIGGSKRSCSNTIVSRILNSIVDRESGIFQVHCLGEDQILRCFRRIRRQDKFSRLVAITESKVYCFCIADVFLL